MVKLFSVPRGPGLFGAVEVQLSRNHPIFKESSNFLGIIQWCGVVWYGTQHLVPET